MINNLLFLLISISLFSQSSVGSIVFDKKLDDPSFELCNKGQVIQYFNDSKGFQFEGEKYTLDKIFFEKFENTNLIGETGLIRIRFVVNCNGESGYFRIISMDENYLLKNFNSLIINQLLTITKSLNGWIPKTYQSQEINYYQYLIFKIIDGNLIEILP